MVAMVAQKPSKLDEEQQRIGTGLGKLLNDLIDYAINKLVEYMTSQVPNKEEITRERVFQVLEDTPEALNPKLLDEIIAQDGRIIFLVNSALALAGSILRQNREWYIEMKENGDMILLKLIATHRPDLYELLKGKPKLTTFLINYVLTKLGLR